MPLFVIMGHDTPNSTEKRQEIRPQHLQRLQVLHAQNRLVVAGPTPIEHNEPAMSGSLIIAHFDSLEHAKAWAGEEPYLLGGVYSHVDVKPFVQVLPKVDNHV
ncbi:MAG: YciI family protein [Moraxella sp.]